ncbi:MAG: hypothetical protein R8G66_23095 [Cytophagales bacterium]|nr:hypothetical protein [Cytophagales bacterium]
MSDRVNARLPKPLAEHVKKMVGPEGLYETPSEYLRSLIRKDMNSDVNYVSTSLIEGFTDISDGRYFESTGDWEKDKAILADKEAAGWK